MPVTLLFGHDKQVADWRWASYGWPKVPFKYDACIGLVKDNELCGAIFLHGANGNDVQLSYYAERALTAGIVRTIGQFIIEAFDPARVTVIVSKRNKRWIRSCQRFGFKLEGAQRCYFGKQDCNRNTGVRLVMFRNMMEHIARPTSKTKAA